MEAEDSEAEDTEIEDGLALCFINESAEGPIIAGVFSEI